MKKYVVLLCIFFDVVLITFFINLYSLYSYKNNILSDKLNGNLYDDEFRKLELERDSLIDEIELDIEINLDGVYEYNEIKKMLDDKYDELNNENTQLVNRKEQLTNQNNILRNTYNEILEEERKKSTYMISNIPKINQYSMGYPTGCESAALTNLLRFWGVSVSMGDIVDVLPKGDLPYFDGNVRYGGNPYLEFVGHPSTYSSYGVYEQPIMQVANVFKSGIINGTGMSLDSVLNIVKEDRPVIVWVSMNMAVPYISKSWIYKPTGEKISWMANEHALLVVGYNESQVIVSDSLNGGIRYYDKSVFGSRYNTYGKRALYY